MKTPLPRIAGLNLAVMLLLAVGLRFIYRHDALGFTFGMTLTIIGQLVVIAFLATVSHTPGMQQAYWLSALLVLLIGFGACFAGSF